MATLIEKCFACPVRCGANRTERAGFCNVQGLKIAKYYLHPFEEPCISFNKGSGTVFFTGCNLKCVFCQNYELSRAARGMEITPARLADIFRELEDAGADNISLVTPSHLIYEIEKAFRLYRPKIPVVYNSGGYDSVETLKKLEGIVDIYLPDYKVEIGIPFQAIFGQKRLLRRGGESDSVYGEQAPAIRRTDGGRNAPRGQREKDAFRTDCAAHGDADGRNRHAGDFKMV